MQESSLKTWESLVGWSNILHELHQRQKLGLGTALQCDLGNTLHSLGGKKHTENTKPNLSKLNKSKVAYTFLQYFIYQVFNMSHEQNTHNVMEFQLLPKPVHVKHLEIHGSFKYLYTLKIIQIPNYCRAF